MKVKKTKVPHPDKALDGGKLSLKNIRRASNLMLDQIEDGHYDAVGMKQHSDESGTIWTSIGVKETDPSVEADEA
jgi:hypothetical protein